MRDLGLFIFEPWNKSKQILAYSSIIGKEQLFAVGEQPFPVGESRFSDGE